MDFEEFKVEDKDRPIVIIDSGAGGLNVLMKLSNKYPIENFVYICDNEFLPLGNKNKQVLNKRISKMIKQIKNLNPKSILIACNTIDSICGDFISSSFPYIEVFGIIEPTMKVAVSKTRTKSIVVLGTKNTIESQSYMTYALAKKGLNIYGVECINLAKAIEENEDVDNILREETSVLEGIELDTLVLGCTHYSLIKDKVAKKFKGITIIDSAEELITHYDKTHNVSLENKANKQKVYVFLTKIEEAQERKISRKIPNYILRELNL